MREQRRPLGQQGDPAPVGRDEPAGPRNLAGAEADGAGGGPEQPGDEMEERRLAGSVGADERGDTPPVDRQVEVDTALGDAGAHRHRRHGDTC